METDIFSAVDGYIGGLFAKDDEALTAALKAALEERDRRDEAERTANADSIGVWGSTDFEGHKHDAVRAIKAA